MLPGQLYTIDSFFLESVPFEERSLVDKVLIVVVRIITHKCHTHWAVSGLGHSSLDL